MPSCLFSPLLEEETTYEANSGLPISIISITIVIPTMGGGFWKARSRSMVPRSIFFWRKPTFKMKEEYMKKIKYATLMTGSFWTIIEIKNA